MIKLKKKICKTCGKECFLWAHGNCKSCSMRETAKKQIAKKKMDGSTDKKEKFFRFAWDSNDKHCEECGRNLPVYDRFFIHHILGKSKFPCFKYDVRNVILLCRQHHMDIESAVSAPKMKVYPYCEATKKHLLQTVGIDYVSPAENSPNKNNSQ